MLDPGARGIDQCACAHLYAHSGVLIGELRIPQRTDARGRNEGIDIGAPAGSSVVAAADGTIATITKDTQQVPIIVIRHEGGLLTVYAGVDGITVAKGDRVQRGQKIGVVRAANPAFLHFEVRRGVESTDPSTFLQ